MGSMRSLYNSGVAPTPLTGRALTDRPPAVPLPYLELWGAHEQVMIYLVQHTASMALLKIRLTLTWGVCEQSSTRLARCETNIQRVLRSPPAPPHSLLLLLLLLLLMLPIA